MRIPHLLLWPWLALPAWAGSLTLLTEQNAPFNFQADEHTEPAGLSTDVVKEMVRRAKLEAHITLVPWARGYSRAQTQADTCVFSTARMAEREPLFNWIGPISSNRWALFARSDFKGQVLTLDDARRYRIGTPRLDAKTEWLQSQGFTKLEITADDSYNPRMLEGGRFDLWIAGIYKGPALAEAQDVHTLKQVLVVHTVDYYLACSKRTADADVAALSAALESMRQDGTLKRIQEVYPPAPSSAPMQ